MSGPSSPEAVHKPPQHKVFINFRGAELRLNFVSHLEDRLTREGINLAIDKKERKGQPLQVLFTRIKQSRIALVVISPRYTESHWCLDELVKIKERVEEEAMVMYPVFYKVTVNTVKKQEGTFGDKFRDLAEKNPDKATGWKEALVFVTKTIGETVHEQSDEGVIIKRIVEEIKKILDVIPMEERDSPREITSEESPESCLKTSPFVGLEACLEQLEEKLELESDRTRTVGVVGMPGIGKTTLAKQLLVRLGDDFMYKMVLEDIREKSKPLKSFNLQDELLKGLWDSKNDEGHRKGTRFTLDDMKSRIYKSRVLVVLDRVSEKEQITEFRRKCSWIKEGSKIIITTSSKSVIKDKGMVDDTYLLQGLSDTDGFKHLSFHAFVNHTCPLNGSFTKLARQFVDYSRGHPSVLKVLGGELRKKNETYWKEKLGTLAKSPSHTIQDVLRIPYVELSEQHKNAFLDIACFFRFDDEYHVKTLLDSSAPNANEIRDLADKFLIDICAGRLEMNDLLYAFALELVSQESPENIKSGRRLFNHGDIVTVLQNKEDAINVRGIFLDMSKLTKNIFLDIDIFAGMHNLRYLKFFNSCCPKDCEADCKLNSPDGLEFKLPEIRYLHWLKCPLKKLPRSFNPQNLINLKLPYSQIEQLWEEDMDTSKLKWLDLNHSRKLHSLWGLAKAQNLQSKESETGRNNMESLVFMNLRGCTSLRSLPEMNLISLKTLILSDCSKLDEFLMVVENLEELYLDGTAITGLPLTIWKLQKLFLLNLKDCKKFSSFPDCLEDMKSLEELTLSGCSSLESFPKVKKNMKKLKTLSLDGTAIIQFPDLFHGQTSSLSQCDLCEWPRGIYGLSSVRRLCLSRNKFKSVPGSISNLYHLKWLDLKYCKELTSLPMLPPNLQWFDAHGCNSLEKIANPLSVLLAAPEHLHSTFIFTNCLKLNQTAKNSIVTYVRKKIQLMSDALARYDEGFVLDVLIGICFPGWQVPVWFNQRSVGSELKLEMPGHWNDAGLTGMALCAVVSFAKYHAQNSRLLVRCTCEFTEEDGSPILFSCVLGGWTEHGSDEPRKIESGHVFIGYTSWLQIKKCDPGVVNRKRCVLTKASVRFEVTDGTGQVPQCEVLKCGFSLINAPTETDYTEVYSPTTNNIIHSEGRSGSTNSHSEETYYPNGSEAYAVLSAAPRMDIEIGEEGRSEADKDAAPSRRNSGIRNEMERKESSSSSSRMDENLKGKSSRKSSEKREPMGDDDSPSHGKIADKVNNKTCLPFLDRFLSFRRR